MRIQLAAALLAIMTSTSTSTLHAAEGYGVPLDLQPLVNRANLVRISQYILARGQRCTYCNRYNDNPCMQLQRFRYYLNADPEPRNVRRPLYGSDISGIEFNQLVVDEPGGNGRMGGYVYVNFHKEVTIPFYRLDLVNSPDGKKQQAFADERARLVEGISDALRHIDAVERGEAGFAVKPSNESDPQE